MTTSRHDVQHQKVKSQFAKAADGYVTSRSHAQGEELAGMLELSGEVGGREVLDIATGGGHTALAFARAGARVTATDLTPAMLVAARRFVGAELGAEGSVNFLEAAAEALPFADASFDIVTCRIAAHHFAEPRAFVSEAARLLRPGGLLLLVDNIAPENPGLAGAMNRIEKLRDPSHVRAYGVRQWIDWLAEKELEVFHLSRWRTHKPFREWLERSRTPPEAGQQLERYVLELPAAWQRYFAVVTQDGNLRALSHEAALLAARKLV